MLQKLLGLYMEASPSEELAPCAVRHPRLQRARTDGAPASHHCCHRPLVLLLLLLCLLVLLLMLLLLLLLLVLKLVVLLVLLLDLSPPNPSPRSLHHILSPLTH